MLPEDHRERGRASAPPAPSGSTWRALPPAWRAAFALVVLAAVGLRAALFLVSLADPPRRQLEEDSHGYLALASSLAAGQGFARVHGLAGTADEPPTPELTRTPGYPAALALVQILAGPVVPVTIVAQHLAGLALAAAVAVACARRFGRRAALGASLWLALDVQGAALGNLILTEAFFCALLTAAALMAPGLWKRPDAARAALVGALLALATFVKPTAVVLPALLSVALLASALRRGRSTVLPALVLALAAYAPVAAWMARNARQAGRYVFSVIPRYQLLAEHAAAALARGRRVTIEEARRQLIRTAGVSGPRLRYAALSGDEEARLRQLALGTIRGHLGAFVRESALRSLNMLAGPDKNALKVIGLERISLGVVRRERSGPAAPPLAWLLLGMQVLHVLAVYALVAIAVLRGVSARALPAALWLWLGCAAGILAPSLGAPGDPRYRWPVLPLLIACGASVLSDRPARAVAA